MNFGKIYNFGDVVLANVQFTDTFEIKTRPVLILFEDFGNIVVAGITSNIEMKGISLTKKEGMIKDSIIKINYIFTISENMVKRHIFKINNSKKEIIRKQLIEKLS